MMKHKYQDTLLYQHFAKTKGYKDEVFKFALSLVDVNNPKDTPINIVEVGTTRNVSKHCRVTDGWSTFFWADYLSDLAHESSPKHERKVGIFCVCDIDERALACAGFMLKRDGHEAPLYVLEKATALFALSSGIHWDLVYLDGSDDPRETKDQFEWAIENPDAVIVVDDSSTKGALIKTTMPSRLFSIAGDFDGFKTTHYMTVYHKSIGNESIV